MSAGQQEGLLNFLRPKTNCDSNIRDKNRDTMFFSSKQNSGVGTGLKKILQKDFEYLKTNRDYQIRVIVFALFAFSVFIRISMLGWGLQIQSTSFKWIHPDETKTYIPVESFPDLFLSGNGFHYRYPNLPKNLMGITYQSILSCIRAVELSLNTNLDYITPPAQLFCRLVSLILGVISIWFAYCIAKRFFGMRTAIFSVLILNFPSLFLSNAAVATSDVPVAFFFTLVIFLAIKIVDKSELKLWDMFLLSSVGGMATATKYTAAVVAIIPIIVAIHCLKNGKTTPARFIHAILISWLGLFIGFIIFFPGVYLDKTAFQNGLSSLVKYHSMADKTLSFQNILDLFPNLMKGLSWPVPWLAMLGIYFAVKKRRFLITALMLFSVVPYLAIMAKSFIPRYGVIFMPILAVFAAYALNQLWETRILGKRKTSAAILPFILIFFFASIPFAIQRYTTDSHYATLKYVENNIPGGKEIGLDYLEHEKFLKSRGAQYWMFPQLPGETYKQVPVNKEPEWILMNPKVKKIMTETASNKDLTTKRKKNPRLIDADTRYFYQRFTEGDLKDKYKLVKTIDPKSIFYFEFPGDPVLVYRKVSIIASE